MGNKLGPKLENRALHTSVYIIIIINYFNVRSIKKAPFLVSVCVHIIVCCPAAK